MLVLHAACFCLKLSCSYRDGEVGRSGSRHTERAAASRPQGSLGYPSLRHSSRTAELFEQEYSDICSLLAASEPPPPEARRLLRRSQLLNSLASGTSTSSAAEFMPIPVTRAIPQTSPSAPQLSLPSVCIAEQDGRTALANVHQPNPRNWKRLYPMLNNFAI
jgi:hypothetical protein